MGEQSCRNCGAELTCLQQRVYCSTFCMIEYQNKKHGSRFIDKIDKCGRHYTVCSKCGRRYKKLSAKGKYEVICNKCLTKLNHKTKEGSQIIEKEFVNGKKRLKMKLELTEYNRSWHYINGHPVQGLQNALNFFRARCHHLVNYEGWRELK